MLEKAWRKAIQTLEEMYNNRAALAKAVGKEVGSSAQRFVFLKISAPLVQKLRKGHGPNSREVNATKQCDIHHDEVNGVNGQGHGTLIAAIYLDDDGYYHKMMGERWYAWNGAEWV